MTISGRIQELDGVRGIAVLLVVVYHAVLFNPTAANLVPAMKPYGHAGVDLFFVLSGFLITGILLDAKGRPAYFRNFYAKRALRIWPLYYILLSISFGIVPLLAHYAHLAVGEYAVIQSKNKLVYILLLQNLWYSLEVSPTLLAMTWSLAIEEQFYVFWPALVLLCSRKNLAYILAAAACISPGLRLWALLHGFNNEEIYRMTWFRLDGLALGGLIALWCKSDFFNLRYAKWLALGSLVIGIAGFPAMPTWMLDSLLSVACFGVVVLAIWCSLSHSAAGVLFRLGWLRYVGKVSYCLYLIHQPMYYALAGLVKQHVGRNRAASFFVMPLGLAASLVVASLSWYLFESQILKLKNRLEYHDPPTQLVSGTG